MVSPKPSAEWGTRTAEMREWYTLYPARISLTVAITEGASFVPFCFPLTLELHSIFDHLTRDIARTTLFYFFYYLFIELLSMICLIPSLSRCYWLLCDPCTKNFQKLPYPYVKKFPYLFQFECLLEVLFYFNCNIANFDEGQFSINLIHHIPDFAKPH